MTEKKVSQRSRMMERVGRIRTGSAKKPTACGIPVVQKPSVEVPPIERSRKIHGDILYHLVNLSQKFPNSQMKFSTAAVLMCAHLHPGITTDRIADMLRLSQTTVRTALNTWIGKGLVENIRSRDGMGEYRTTSAGINFLDKDIVFIEK